MKRKIIALVMAICVAVGAAGCGDAAENDGSIRNDRNAEDDGRFENGGSAGNGESTENGGSKGSGISIITIDGEKYDLSDDFQKVVGKMVKNGLQPIDDTMAPLRTYDEDGKYSKAWDFSDYTDSTILVLGRERPIMLNTEICSIIVDRYIFTGKYNCIFETADGITQDSDEDDLKELEGYVPYRGIIQVKSEGCRALYVDGKIVDLEEYRDEYEAWLKDAEEEGTASASKNRLDAKHYPSYSRMQEICSLDSIERCIELPYLEEEMLLTFAVQEACEKLEAKKIKSFDIVHYSYEPEGMMVEFEHYYYDENWDSSKFRREE